MGAGRALARAAIGLLLVLAASGAGAVPTDVSVKAAFLPRFARYVTWPASAMPKGGDPFVLCVIGTDPFGALLDQTAGSQTVDGRRILVRRLNSLGGASDCQIAFVSGNRLGELNDMADKPVLTVTDGPNGTPRGIIHFAVVAGRVRFFIDQASAQQRRLSTSALACSLLRSECANDPGRTANDQLALGADRDLCGRAAHPPGGDRRQLHLQWRLHRARIEQTQGFSDILAASTAAAVDFEDAAAAQQAADAYRVNEQVRLIGIFRSEWPVRCRLPAVRRAGAADGRGAARGGH